MGPVLGPRLVGTHVTLAPIGPEHLSNYLVWFADPAITRFLAADTPPSRGQEDEWFERPARSTTDIVWGLFVEGQHIGSTGLHQIDWRNRRATSGTMIGDAAFWGRGIGAESMLLRTRFAFEELGLE